MRHRCLVSCRSRSPRLVRLKNWERYGLKTWIEADNKRQQHNVLAIALAQAASAIGKAAEMRGWSRLDENQVVNSRACAANAAGMRSNHAPQWTPMTSKPMTLPIPMVRQADTDRRAKNEQHLAGVGVMQLDGRRTFSICDATS